MSLDQSLVDAAIPQALIRFPSGSAGAEAVRTETGQILTSVFFDPPNAAASGKQCALLNSSRIFGAMP